MIVKRILATIIDLIIAFIPAFINGMLYEHNIVLILYKTLLLYVIHTTISILIIKMTPGERLSCIKLVSLKTNDIKKLTLVLKNLAFSLYFLIILLGINKTSDLIMAILLFFSLNGTIFLKNKNEKHMTGLDLLFKVYYTKCSK
ncbi:RDD family protein [Calditrichota bacterium LG25]